MSIGEKLREARKEQGLTLNDIQNKTKIRSKYLKAIEEENFDQIPGEAYTRVFIKGFANEVGLNGNEMVNEYLKQKQTEEIIEEEHYQTKKIPEPEENNLFFQNTFFRIAVAILLLILIGFVIYNVFLLNGEKETIKNLPDQQIENLLTQSDDEVEEPSNNNNITDNKNGNSTVSDVKNNTTNTPEDTKIIVDTEKSLEKENNLTLENQNKKSDKIETNKDTNTNEGTNTDQSVEEQPESSQEKNQAQESTIEVILTAKCWLRISVDGEKVFEGTLEKGDTRKFTGKEQLSMRMGNAGGVKIKRDDKIIGPLGKSGEVTNKVFDF